MCSWLKTLVPLAGVLIVLGAGTASAQDLVTVKVPFPFEVRGQVLPAGTYTVQDDHGLLFIRGEYGTHGAVVALTTPAAGQDPSGVTPALTFVRHESGYRLASVWESKDRGELISRQ